jgi:hypothetical protein
MILGMSTATFTLFHVALSLVGIAAGLVVLFAMITDRLLPAWTAVFLAMTVATSVTGFMFPVAGLDPPRIVGIISLIVLAVALVALYGRRLAGVWRPIYVATAVVALYLNVFVAVVQSFQKIPLLQALAPTQSEPPFLVTQLVVLVLFAAAGTVAALRFHPTARGYASA